MTNLQRTVLFAVTLIFWAAGLAPLFGAEMPNTSVKLTPEVIKMEAFYGGAQLRIEGVAAPDAKVVVVIRGPARSEVFNTKRRFGPIWINSGQVRVSEVPSQFISFSAEPLSAFLTPASVAKHQLDETAIKHGMRIEPLRGELVLTEDVIREHYVTLKKERRTYQALNGSVQMAEPGQDGTPFAVDFRFPKKAPPATYQVTVYECRDGDVFRTSSVPLEVVKVGFPEALANLATRSAPLYGVLAVFVAALAGFGIDFLTAKIFGKKVSAGH